MEDANYRDCLIWVIMELITEKTWLVITVAEETSDIHTL